MRGERIRDFIILGLDIGSYSEKELSEQKAAQEIVDGLLSDAVGALKAENPDPVHWLDAGDGGYALFTWGERDVLEVIDHFFELLGRQNARCEQGRDISVRAALHKGQVIAWSGRLGAKYTGHPINECARLLSGMDRRHASQVVCSGAFFGAIQTFGESVKHIRLRDIKDKHNRDHAVYNIWREPGFGEVALEGEPHPNPLLR